MSTLIITFYLHVALTSTDYFLFLITPTLFLCHSFFLGPFIVAGPLATLTNWVNEFKKWLPSCPVVLYHGSKLEREEIRCVTAVFVLFSFCLALSSRLLCSLLPLRLKCS